MPEIQRTDDVLLRLLVTLTDENPEMEVGLTVTVPGATVSGMLIASTKWLEHLAAMGEGAANEFLSTFAKTFDELSSGHVEAGEYVHLRDARFISASGFVPPAGMLWRGRISEVSSWAIGQISTEE